MENKPKKLEPRKLCPPPEAAKRMMERDRRMLPDNPIVRFVKIFFGEGF